MNNIWMTWGDVFHASLFNLWVGFIDFVPRLIFAILLFVVGWIVGSILAKAVEQIFDVLRIDKALRSVGVEDMFRKTGMNLDTGYFVGQLVKWFVIIVALLPSLSLVLPVIVDPAGNNTNAVAYFLQVIVLGYLVKVIIATIILIISAIFAEVLSSFVRAGAKSMGMTTANLFGTIAKYAVWMFGFIIALGQLGVAEYYMSVLFTGIIAMLSLGGALAFGLGGKDAAARLISRLGEEVSHRQ